MQSVAVAVVYTSRCECECECNGYEQTSVWIYDMYIIICMWMYNLPMNVF